MTAVGTSRPLSRTSHHFHPSALAGFAVVILALLAGVVYWKILHPPTTLVGNVLQTGQPAADFSLIDQDGQPITLSQFRGKPVAMTFVYTNCPDVCPLIASNMHTAYTEMGADANRIAMLAVTVDPERDNVDAVQRFTNQHHLQSEWHFLTARRPQLESVWKSYGILSQPVDVSGAPVPGGSTSNPESIEHTAPVFMIDQRGTVRVLLDTTFTPADLVQDFQSLLSS
jgi:protein SCO1/2